MKKCKLVEEQATCLAEYSQVPISFLVSSVYEVSEPGPNEFKLKQRELEAPYLKDYDGIKEEGPSRWGRQWDLSNWGFLSAFCKGVRVGGVAVAFDTDGIDMLECRNDLAVVWDIRIHPSHRGEGIGTKLFRAAEKWATQRGCRQLKVETQNINVPACKFYAKQGCVLRVIDRHAYPDFPDEIKLLWYKDL